MARCNRGPTKPHRQWTCRLFGLCSGPTIRNGGALAAHPSGNDHPEGTGHQSSAFATKTFGIFFAQVCKIFFSVFPQNLKSLTVMCVLQVIGSKISVQKDAVSQQYAIHKFLNFPTPKERSFPHFPPLFCARVHTVRISMRRNPLFFSAFPPLKQC